MQMARTRFDKVMAEKLWRMDVHAEIDAFTKRENRALKGSLNFQHSKPALLPLQARRTSSYSGSGARLTSRKPSSSTSTRSACSTAWG